jgi:hypothetical protein
MCRSTGWDHENVTRASHGSSSALVRKGGRHGLRHRACALDVTPTPFSDGRGRADAAGDQLPIRGSIPLTDGESGEDRIWEDSLTGLVALRAYDAATGWRVARKTAGSLRRRIALHEAEPVGRTFGLLP